MHLLLRYTQALITQMAQTAVCNRHHSLDQQLCRWLLLSLDRLQGNELRMTQELIANMLGVRREGVTEARAEAAAGRADPLCARPHHGARPPGPGAAQLRVLCGGQEGVRPPAAGQRRLRDATAALAVGPADTAGGRRRWPSARPRDDHGISMDSDESPMNDHHRAAPTPPTATSCSPRCPMPSGSAGSRTWSRCELALGQVLCEAGQHAGLRVLSDHGHRVADVHDAGRRFGRVRGGRQRRRGRHLAVHGRQRHAEPGRGAEPPARPAAARAGAAGRGAARRPGAAACCCATPRR